MTPTSCASRSRQRPHPGYRNGWSDRVLACVAVDRPRSGDPVAMSTYLGNNDAFDQAITDFSERYADQNEQDFEAFVTAFQAGRLEAVAGL